MEGWNEISGAWSLSSHFSSVRETLGPESGDGEDGLGGDSLQLGKRLIEVQLSTARKSGTCGPRGREGATSQGP